MRFLIDIFAETAVVIAVACIAITAAKMTPGHALAEWQDKITEDSGLLK